MVAIRSALSWAKGWAARFAVRQVMPRSLTLARAVLPCRSHVFLIGYPPTEGNAVETARALLQRYNGDIYWAQAPSIEYLAANGIAMHPRLHLISKSSPRSLWYYATAEAVFFTHGLYGEPNIRRGKPVINLWHGAGMKMSTGSVFGHRTQKGRPCDVVAAPNRMWGDRVAELCDVPAQDILYSGYPRNDQLFQEVSTERLEALGINGPFVIWLPSYRTTAALGTGGLATAGSWSDTADPTESIAVTSQFVHVARALMAQGVQTVVKPHPMDSEARSVEGTVYVDDEALQRANVPLYQLLGASAALVTDVSSVWSDYLLVDRPIGFYFPDRDSYESGRGFYPNDVLNWLPGSFLDESHAWERFAQQVTQDPSAESPRRQEIASWCGLVQTDRAADDLLDELRLRFPHLTHSIRPRSDAT